MTVWGAEQIEAAVQATSAKPGESDTAIHIAENDVVTPLARERARELGIRIVIGGGSAESAEKPTPSTAPATLVATPGTPAPTGPPPGPPPAAPAAKPPPASPPRPPAQHPGRRFVADMPGPPSGALYRRGAPVVTKGTRRTDDTAGGGGRVVVVGAGHVGMVTAMRLADADLFEEIVLVDIDEGRAQGIALDLTHTAALAGFTTRIRGTVSVEDAGAADYVVITAGRPRQPGMSRADLVSVNAEIVGDIAQRVSRTSPNAVLVVVTNPLDEMTYHAWRMSGFPASRVIGMAGVLDTARFQALASLTGVARADRISAVALGSHGDEMVIPLSQATVDGRPLSERIPAQELTAIVDRARDSGAEVVNLLRSGSAFLAPGMSAARMVLAMARDSNEVMPAAVLAEGAYGIHGVYLGLPARLGRNGVREIVELDLAPEERAALRRAADRIRERIGTLSQQLPAAS